MTNAMKIASIYVNFSGDATPTAEEMYPYLALANDFGSALATGSIIQDNTTLSSVLFGDALTTADKVKTVFQALFDRDPLQEGLDYWVDQFENNPSYVNATSLAEVVLRGAEVNEDQTDYAKVTADVGTLADELAAYVPTETETPTETEGSDFYLTTGVDALTGTDANDTFIADLNQVQYTGAVANTLASGDRIDGGAGTDTLDAQLTTQQVISLDNVIDVQARTTSVEIVEIEAQDNNNANVVASANNGYNVIVVDAKNMTGVQKIGSDYSDGDLVIENLTTLTDEGVIRNTADMTVTMTYTDNMNSDSDASDLTVLFDEDYLNTTTSAAGSSLTINMINTLNLALDDGSSLIEGFESLTFSVGTQEITVDVAGAELSAVQGLIANALTAAGITTVSVSTYTEPAYFGTNIYYEDTNTTYTAGTFAGNYTAFVLTNSGSEELSEGGFTLTGGQRDGSLAYSQDDATSSVVTQPITINVELEKVGRDGDGGNLIIGGKDTTGSDSDVDQNDGIQVFDITVLGDETKPSNLGQILSTNDALTTINVASETRTDGSYASLTVRGEDDANTPADVTPFGGTLEVFNANAFMGDLFIGNNDVSTDNPDGDVASYADNIDTFTATGGGNVTLFEEISANGAGAGSFTSTDDNAYSVTTGSGSDKITVDANSGAQLTVVTAAGNDTIAVSIDGQDDSGSTETYATISSTSGNNTVTTTSADSTHDAKIDLGTGADTVNGNSVNITVDTNEGNDTIYAENTGTKASVILAEGTYKTANDAYATMTNDQFLNGREVTITVAAPEETTAGTGEANDFTNGYEIPTFTFESASALSTEKEFFTAVMNAINNDSVVNKLVKATMDSNDNLTITYLIDGSTIAGEQLVEIKLSDELTNDTDVSAELLAAVQADQKNSAITAANVLAAYDDLSDNAGNDVDEVTVATSGTMNVIVFNSSTLQDTEAITISINGVSVTVPNGAGTVEADLVAASPLTFGDSVYTVTSTGADNITLTQTAGTPDVVTTANATIVDVTLGVNVVNATSTTGVLGSNGDDSTSTADNVVNGGTGDDVIVLSSNDSATDTVVFDANGFGNDTIVHFETGANGDLLDFTAWLNNETSASSSVVSEQDIARTVDTITNITENTVAQTTFTILNGASATALTYESMSDAQVLAALNNNGTFAADAQAATLVGSTQKSILMIENVDNLGEYKVYEVTSNSTTADDADAFTAATLVGSVDFGETTTLVTANLADLA